MSGSVSPEEFVATTVESIVAPDPAWESRAWERLDSLTKPPRSLGRLEDLAVQVACAQQTLAPSVDHKRVILMAGDHGVVAEGVSAYPADVTWQMVSNFVHGGAAINQIARSVGADVEVYDVGVARDLADVAGIHHENVARGTANMAIGPAMSRAQCARAVAVGIDAARQAATDGVTLLGTGEMGIGNSTAAATLTAAYTGASPEQVVGPGTGLSAEGVFRKVEVVGRALERNSVTQLDALGTLAAVGGLEIAGLAGVMLGAASCGVVVIADGFISGSAALAAVALCPRARAYLMPSHRSAEPGHAIALAHLGLAPVFELDMRLGEGTGAALAMSVIDAACAMMAGMATFAEAGVDGSGA